MRLLNPELNAGQPVINVPPMVAETDQAVSDKGFGRVSGDDPDEILGQVRRLLADILPSSAEEGRTLRDSGLDSISAARLVLELEAAFGVSVPMAEIGRCAGAEELVDRVTGATGRAAPRGTRQADVGARFDPFAVTPMQEAYLVGRQPEFTSDPVGCHIYREFDVENVDVERLRAAWQQVVDRQDVLRVVFGADNRQRVQERSPAWTMPVHDGSSDPPEAFRARVEATRSRMSHRTCEADEWPLFAIEVSVGPGGWDVVHLGIDALITDGVGLGVLLDTWWRSYYRPGSGPGEPAVALRDCVLALQEGAEGPVRRADLEFWLDRLEGMPPGPDVLVHPPAAPTGGYRRRPLDDVVAAPLWTALRERASQWGVSPSALVLAVFAEMLDRHVATGPFSLVLTTSHRSRLPAAVDGVAGPFTSSAVIVVEDVGERSLEETARSLHSRLWEGLDHSTVSGVEVLRELRTRGAPGVPLPVVFTSLLDGGRPSADDAVPAVSYAVSQTTDVALDAQLWEADGQLHLHWDVADGLLSAGAAEVLFAAFGNALTTAAEEPAAAERRPLNELQQAYYVARAAGPAPWDGCQVHHSFAVSDLDLDRLTTAWTAMVADHDVLRACLTRDGDSAVRPAGPSRWRIPVVEGASLDGDRLVSRAFPLDRWPQFDLRVGREDDGESSVHVTLDLACCDGRSVHLLMRELFRRYAAGTAEPSRPTGSHADLTAWRSQQREDPAYADWARHWELRLADMPPGPALPMAGARGGDPRRVRHEGRVAGWRGLRDRAREAGVGADALLLAVLTETLADTFTDPFAVPVVRWTGASERFRPGELTALSWIAHDPRAPLWDRARGNQRTIDADAAADGVSGLAELRRKVLARRREGAFGYPVVYTGLLDLADHALPPGVRSGPWLTCTPDVSMDCIAMDLGDDELRCFWDATEADFEPGVPAALFERFLALLRGLAEPAAAVPEDEGRGLSADDRHRILEEWNDTAAEFSADGPVHLRFEEQARIQPDAVALRWRGGTMTYQCLDRRANVIAWRLRDLGVTAETVVGICVGRGPELVEAVFGILKAGGAYLPVEPYLPAERAIGMLADAGAAVLLTTAGGPGWAPPAGVAVVELDADPEIVSGETIDPARRGRGPEPQGDVDSTAYVIFTSGSTGKPKGVVVTHRPLHNLFQWCRRTFGLGPDDVGLSVTSLGFDLSVFDILGLLGFGAGLYIADAAQQKDPELLLDVLLREPITFWNSAPTTLNQVEPLFPRAGEPGTDTLRLVFLSGDYTPLPLPGRLRSAFGKARLVSLGGATEATVWSNFFEVDTVDPNWRSVPYGRPIANCRYYILDDAAEPSRPGTPGDLFIAGACLSQGYANRPDLTAERFVPEPFVGSADARMYRTGDRATYLPDGTISFLGREDNQVKIRGFRVELGEIEHRLRAHPQVSDVVVLARPDHTGDRKLVAHVVAAGARPSVPELRRHAETTLPDYMVPNDIGFVAAFPATTNGKIDRDALPWPLPAADDAADAAASPSPRAGPDVAELRTEVVGLFCGLLGRDDVDPAGDLWDQGATSFTMVQVSAALRKHHGQRIPVATLLEVPTVEGIALAVAAQLGGGPERASAAVDPPPEPAPSRPAEEEGRPGPGEVDLLDAAQRTAFQEAGWSLRERGDGEFVELGGTPVAGEHYRWRATRRDFDSGGPVPLERLGRLLGLLRPLDGNDRFLYPSAGRTYAVQVYVHVRPDGVHDIAPGIYYYRAHEHALERVDGDDADIDRQVHFVYNREIYDCCGFELFLVGQSRGVEPLYNEDGDLFMAVEAGYIGGLLMSGQAACGIGLCPIGTVAFERIRDRLRLDGGHRFLHAFLGGAASYPATGAVGVPPFGIGDEPAAQEAEPPARSARNGRAVDARPSATAPSRDATGDVAVIGVAGRFPGARTMAELWDHLANGRQVLGPFPRDRAAALGVTGSLAEVVGGFLDGIDRFDSLLFRISPHEAATLDPQLCLLLDAVWRCLEDAGLTPDGVRQLGRVGVFVATMWPDHHAAGVDRWRDGAAAEQSGIAADLPNRISHTFGFRGPSVAVNTSCSSSLTALHLAVQSVRAGECATAVVAGVNLISHPYHLALLSGLDLVGAGHGGAFDADASGWLPGEGVGAVLVRPAAGAAVGRDPVHAVIEGTWTGHVGRTPRFGAPDAGALAESLGQMVESVGVGPDAVDYVECAAAGAAIADAAEMEALGAVFSCRSTPVPVGTVKPNFGHLEAASGMSQLAKVVLQLRHRSLAPTVLAPRRSPLVDWDPSVLRVPETREPWTAGRTGEPLRALINSLGATGSYAHAVVRTAAANGEAR